MVLKHTESYRNDFYMHDFNAYFSKGKRALWMLRKMGTDYLVLDNLDKDSESYYRQPIGVNDYFYMINGERVLKVNKQEAINSIISEIKQAA